MRRQPGILLATLAWHRRQRLLGRRQRIARKLGLDVARGPEDTLVYIQFGHAWTRDMG